MHGLMMDTPLMVSSIIRYAANCHGATEIVSRTVEGPIHRYTYRDCYRRVQRLANALTALGAKPDDRIATLAWNGYRHFELYYAISGVGAVCHTINPRLFAEQIVYIVNHAADRFVFVDLDLVPLVERLAGCFAGVEGFVVMTDEAHMPETTLLGALCYETLIGGQPGRFDWPEFDERQAAALCYTSGTTGEPKGVLYSHRSTVLHAFGFLASASGFSAQDTVLPVVPMFHVNAWGAPYSAAVCGAKLVFAGTRLDGASLHELLAGERVTVSLGVPTVWLALVEYLRETGKRLDDLRMLVIGGAAPPLSLITALEEEYGVDVWHGWGMTETSPVGAVGIHRHALAGLDRDDRLRLKLKQGQRFFGVDMKIVDDAGRELPQDGVAEGELLVRGPWIAGGYYRNAAATAAAFDDDGWFRTGDVATIDPDGHVRITDRAKDLIKSGGEWISSIDLENAAMAHPDVARVAAIALPHPKWGERPLLVVVPREGAAPTRDDIIGFLAGKVAKWWLPDDVVFADDLPLSATGKVSKIALRETYRDHPLPTVAKTRHGA
ncbi:MAG: long-chain-fatty-acid--CoA ligase [Alphaproteobacteria bacterium]